MMVDKSIKVDVVRQGTMCLLQQKRTILTKSNKFENQVAVFPQLVQVKASEALEHNNFSEEQAADEAVAVNTYCRARVAFNELHKFRKFG
jgi:hypothetical protein